VGRRNGGLGSCARGLVRAAREITESEFPVELTGEGELVSRFSLGDPEPLLFTYIARCSEEGVEASAGLQGVDGLLDGLPEGARLELLQAILRIPYDYGVTIAMPDSDTVIVSYPSPPPGDAEDYVGSTYTFSLLLAAWLRLQAARLRSGEPVVPFSLD